jgi:NAD(P)-dependent dehydrogenase (short-subunit alcohol dehydrogenase family)
VLPGAVFCLTGASSGIGRAVALRLAKAGTTVVLVGRTEAKLHQTAHQIEQLGYPTPIVAPYNFITFTENDAVELALSIGHQFGKLNGLIHCAGYLGSITPLVHYSASVWEEVFRIFVHTPFILTKALLPLLKHTAELKSVIFTRNVQSEGQAYWGAYGAAQAAIGSLVRILREEHPDFPIFAIDPVKVKTALRAKAYPGETGRQLYTPSEVAEFYYQQIQQPPVSEGLSFFKNFF